LMTEVQVDQRSVAWQHLRRSVCVTASRFGDAIGVGHGKPYHFLQSLLEPPCDDEDSGNVYTQHGLRLEADIDEAYQLLTGLETKLSGFWIAEGSSRLAGIIGASPDAKVYQNGTFVGLAEYKAPVYSLHCNRDGGTHRRVPRRHMAQVQGQMAVSDAPWCDYMAVCTSTQQVALLRVHFAARYWSSISASLLNFCSILQVHLARDIVVNKILKIIIKVVDCLQLDSVVTCHRNRVKNCIT